MAELDRKAHALKRMEHLVKEKDMVEECLDMYNDGVLTWSDNWSFGSSSLGVIYWANDLGGLPEKVQKKIKEVESKYDVTVFNITHEFTSFGELWDLWIVAEEDCNDDSFHDFEDGYVYAYVYNVTDDWCSEFGSIHYSVSGGGCVRDL